MAIHVYIPKVMKKICFLLAALLTSISSVICAQDHNPSGVTLPPVEKDQDLTDYTKNDTGFWISGQLLGAYSLRTHHTNRPLTELNVTGGYRFNEYLRVGIGFGARTYFGNDALRERSSSWAFPLFANVRGNIIPTGYRNVVPYYSLDLGGVIQDGFMWRPTIGIRVGQPRSAFLLGLTYIGQCGKFVDNCKYSSFLGLTLGYEY